MSAVISECGLYRYRLDRDCEGLIPAEFDEDSKVFAYFGINPSTADAMLDDPTVRKWIGFTQRNGGNRFIVGNVFSYRATDVKVIGKVPFPQGPQHFTHLNQIIAEADVLVPCWGGRDKVPKHLREQLDLLLAWLHRSGKPVLHFGTTDGGDPKHPLFLPYTTPLLPLEARPAS